MLFVSWFLLWFSCRPKDRCGIAGFWFHGRRLGFGVPRFHALEKNDEFRLIELYLDKRSSDLVLFAGQKACGKATAGDTWAGHLVTARASERGMESALADGGVERFFACLDRKMAMGPQASVTRPVAVRFDLGGGGSFLLRASPHAPGSVTKEESSSRSEDAVTCTLSCSLKVLLDLAGGRIKPAAAYLRGLIKISGDRAVFMQLRSVLQAAVMELKQEGIGKPGAVSIAVLGATVHAGPDDRYAVYQLEVSEGAASWLLLRRWSELRALERAMAKQRPPGLAAAPGLPRWLDLAGSLEAPFLAQRCGLLVRVRVRVS